MHLGVEAQCTGLLVTLRLRISSSLVALYINFLLVSSTTKTFHCKRQPSVRHFT
jgi:hypothetical protein